MLKCPLIKGEKRPAQRAVRSMHVRGSSAGCRAWCSTSSMNCLCPTESTHASPRTRKSIWLSDGTTCSFCPCHSSKIPLNACNPVKADFCGIAVTNRDAIRRFSGHPCYRGLVFRRSPGVLCENCRGALQFMDCTGRQACLFRICCGQIKLTMKKILGSTLVDEQWQDR